MKLPLHVVLRCLLRSLLIQASWNTRSMLGNGFAHALKPALWWRYRDDAARSAALARHVEHFNAHPYLAGMGLGAVARMEVEGSDPVRIRRFKTALRGPLGGLGDRLVWVGWLPFTATAGLLLLLLGAGPALVVLAFLSVYNAGHVGLRVWAWTAGYEAGVDVAGAIQRARLTQNADRLSQAAALTLGLVLGVVAARGAQSGFTLWLPLGGLLFVIGNRARGRGWRPALSATAVALGVIALVGALS